MKHSLSSCLRGQAIDYLFHLFVTLVFFSSVSYLMYQYYKKFDDVKNTMSLASFLNFVESLPKDPMLAKEIRIYVNYPVYAGERVCVQRVCFYTYYYISGVLSSEVLVRGEEIILK